MNKTHGLKQVAFLCIILTACLIPYASTLVLQSQKTIITGLNQGDELGFSVNGAGDVNGDGFDDVIFSSKQASSQQRLNAGIVYVLFGNHNGVFPVDLSNLSPTQGFKIIGANNNDLIGDSVKGAGDLNRDGIDDIVIGASNVSPLNRKYAGAVYVIFGRRNGLSDIDLNQFTTSQGIQIIGANATDRIGDAVSGAGDVNGDGIQDLIIGAPSANPLTRTWAGVTYVIFGGHQAFSSNIDLNGLTNTQGFMLIGASKIDQFGSSVSGTGDINGDGIDDILIGAPYASRGSYQKAGISYIIFGSKKGFPVTIDLTNLDSTQGAKILGGIYNGLAGSSVSGAGDINGDGIPDFIIGAQGVSNSQPANTGNAYVIFGKKTGFSDIDLQNFSNSQGFKISGANSLDQLGTSVSGAGDANGDGIDDVIVGAIGVGALNDRTTGAAYVIFGRKDGQFSDLNVGNLSASQGVVILGESQDTAIGNSVGGAGDITGDGIDDLIIGGAIGRGTGSGFVYIVTL